MHWDTGVLREWFWILGAFFSKKQKSPTNTLRTIYTNNGGGQDMVFVRMYVCESVRDYYESQ